MANTNRRLKDSEGKMFVPMTVDAGASEEHFIDGGKLIVIGILIIVNLMVIISVSDAYMSLMSKILWILSSLLVSSIVVRYVVLQESYYYKMYKKMKEYARTTPSTFWDVVQIRNTPKGSILMYADLKIGVIISLEKDTIAGKPPEFKEYHKDAISDFYRALNMRKYNYIQLNLMEQAGKDPRLTTLADLSLKSDNPNISDLLEKQVAYLKSRSRIILTERDYFLIYTKDASRAESIIQDINDCVGIILSGGFVSYDIFDAEDYNELKKEENGVKYFDTTSAILNVFKDKDTTPPFEIIGVRRRTGELELFETKEPEPIEKKKGLSGILSQSKTKQEVKNNREKMLDAKEKSGKTIEKSLTKIFESNKTKEQAKENSLNDEPTDKEYINTDINDFNDFDDSFDDDFDDFGDFGDFGEFGDIAEKSYSQDINFEDIQTPLDSELDENYYIDLDADDSLDFEDFPEEIEKSLGNMHSDVNISNKKESSQVVLEFSDDDEIDI